MSTATLCLHRGAILVDRARLAAYTAPDPIGRWFPQAHSKVLETVSTTLEMSCYSIAKEQLAVARHGHRFFGVLDLKTPLGEGVSLAVGIRNSTDKSFPLGFAAGARVFVCDNLAFHSELLVTRKHTRWAEARFGTAIAAAVRGLSSFRDAEADRIRRMQETRLADDAASLYVLHALEQGIVSAPLVPRVWREYREPSFDYGHRGTLWHLLQCFTTTLGTNARRDPAKYARQTIRLQQLLQPGGPHADLPPGLDSTPAPTSPAAPTHGV